VEFGLILQRQGPPQKPKAPAKLQSTPIENFLATVLPWLKHWLIGNSVSRSFFTQLGHGHCLATIAIVLDISLWWHTDLLWLFNRKYSMWSLIGFINDLPLPCRRVKTVSSSNQNPICTWSESVSTFTWC